jgi:exonuclease VII small subunit
MNTPDTTPHDMLDRLNEVMFAAGRDGSHDHLMDVLHDAALDQLQQCCAELDLGDLKAEQELAALLQFKEGFWSACAGQARCDLVERVMQTVYDATESWRDGGLGTDLAYLAWAIAAGTSVQWHSDCATRRLFERLFPADDPVWKRIERP